MIRDPIFGGWDWEGIRQLSFMIISVALFVSFAASTSGNWYDPWEWVYFGVITYSTPLLILSMVAMMAFYRLWQFEGGVN